MTQPAAPIPIGALSRALVGLYASAEAELIAQLGGIARGSISAGDTAQRLAAARAMRQAAQTTVDTLARSMPGLARLVLRTAAQHGAAAAVSQLRGLLRIRVAPGVTLAQRLETLQRAGGLHGSRLLHARTVLPGSHAIDQLAGELASKLSATHPRILRYADDVYRAATVAAAPLQLAGATTGRIAERSAYRQLISQGVSGFVDSRGRNWSLSAYTEMSTRTASAQAYRTATKAQLNDAGVTYYVVSQDGRPCPLCAPWEGQILSDDDTGSVTAPHAGDPGATVTFDVSSTTGDAESAGLMHPNCGHQYVAYLPGVSETADVATAPPTDDELATARDRSDDQATLRGLERGVRSAKLAQSGALDEESARLAQQDVARLQGKIRQHVDRTGLNRRSYREQPNLGHDKGD